MWGGWPRGCQAWELSEMKMFQTRFGDKLLYSDLDTCELGVSRRDDKNAGEKRVDIHDQQ